ncbi:histidine phosphatase family protein [Gleimia hominis]|uniref:Histidine phosphatase family protein n=1 Tax=Gleimia hominis TaxID=595468 RepID=A0ABU3I9L1_9ACTO|nr:histidine phosphatase family protein [Gleimia hominis]MDT3767059.1 histidine phosphatase family protein [Gleimia hominis]
MRTVVHVMRHGEVHNPQAVLYGRMPGFRLSALGQQMAQAAARGLQDAGAQITGVVASPLLRAQQTAQPTADAYGLEVESDARLIEAWNSFEGVPVNRNRAVLANPKYWWRYRNPLRPSWSEPYVDLVRRMRAAVAAARKKYAGGEVLAVSHQLPIWTLRSWVEGRPLAHDPRKRECSLASITSFEFDDATLRSVTYWEPASKYLVDAADMVPGVSDAALAKQN